MKSNKSVSREEYLTIRLELLKKEKELTKLSDEIAEQRQELPWVQVEKVYTLESKDGKKTLSELFGNKKQLIVMWFMYGLDYQSPCVSCSFWADSYNGTHQHIEARDAKFIVVSNNTVEKLEKTKAVKGWTFDWYSSLNSDFGNDFHASMTKEMMETEQPVNFQMKKPHMAEFPGVSVFYKDEDGKIYETYSLWSRGLDHLNGTYQFIDLLPLGRQEKDLKWTMAWLKHKENYE